MTHNLWPLIFVLGIICFALAWFAKHWAQGWRYGLLVLGSGLCVLAVYLDPDWTPSETSSSKDLLLLFAVNAVVITRIKRDAQPVGTGADTANDVEPPKVAIAAVAFPVYFLFRSIAQRDEWRIAVFGALIAAVAMAIYLNKKRGIPSRKTLVILSWVVIALAVLASYENAP